MYMHAGGILSIGENPQEKSQGKSQGKALKMAAKPLAQLELLESFIFVTEPADALKCLICHEVAGDPQQHDQCGRIYCKKCLDEYGRHKPCPFCRKNRPQYFKDSKSESLLLKLS